MKHCAILFAAALGGAMAATPAAAARIVLNDLGGAGEGTQARLAFSMAADFWGRRLVDDVVINLDVGFRELDPGVLGQAGANTAVIPIEAVQERLAATGSSRIDTIAVANLPTLKPGLDGFGAVDVRTSAPRLPTGEGVDTTRTILDADGSGNNSYLDAHSANLKALGFDGFGDVADGTIAFSTKYRFDFNPLDGIAANAIDFLSVAVHEIGHVLGFVSGVDVYDVLGAPDGALADDPDYGLLNLNDYAMASVLDLFRYSAAPGGGAVLDWSVGGSPFFSIDGQTAFGGGYFSTGAYNGDGWQASHWKDNIPGTAQLGMMDPTVAYGQMGRVTTLDLAAFDAIGWTLDHDVLGSNRSFTTREIYLSAVPEPDTWVLLVGGFMAAGWMARRARLAPQPAP